MSDAQKYQRKKNILIIVFMVLLVAFVCIICGIFIYAKNNPAPKLLSPDEIEIKQMQTLEYTIPVTPGYAIIEESSRFIVTENGTEFELILTEEKEIKLSGKEQISIIVNDQNINNNIKQIYEKADVSVILTETGELYRVINNELIDRNLEVEQILTDMSVKEIVSLNSTTDSIYILTDEEILLNIDTKNEYNGVVKELRNDNITIYIYENGGFGTEEGKIFVDENNTILVANICFDNKIITQNSVVYEINPADKTLSTSSLGVLSQIGYRKGENDNTYTITVLTNTGKYDFNSNYYYTR